LVGKTQLKIQCTAGFSGGGEQYFILQRILGMSFIQVQNQSDPIFDISNLLPGQNYTYRVCAASVTYSGTVSCANTLSLKTEEENGE
jgi:hypothetical protein